MLRPAHKTQRHSICCFLGQRLWSRFQRAMPPSQTITGLYWRDTDPLGTISQLPRTLSLRSVNRHRHRWDWNHSWRPSWRQLKFWGLGHQPSTYLWLRTPGRPLTIEFLNQGTVLHSDVYTSMYVESTCVSAEQPPNSPRRLRQAQGKRRRRLRVAHQVRGR